LPRPLGLPTFASVIAMMLGLGAGIDYSLLIIGRYASSVQPATAFRTLRHGRAPQRAPPSLPPD
jgi:RND superfamily putative drug exporter